MKIGKIAEQLGTSITALRFYENKGLVNPRRSAKGTRLYDEESIKRFKAILDFAALDIPLEQLQLLTQIRQTQGTGDNASREVEKQLRLLEQTLQQKLQRIEKNLNDIQQAQQALHRCHHCQQTANRNNCNPCPESRALLETQIMHLIWDEELS